MLYGYDNSDRVTAISQSTADGEGNSNQTHYTNGFVTQLNSGNNVVNYEYDGKGRMTKVGLNGNNNYLQTAYSDDNLTTTTTNAKGEIFSITKDNAGNIINTKYGNNSLTSCTYNADNTLNSQTVGEDVFSYEYDNLDRLKKVYRNNTQIESYDYNNYGNLASNTIENGAKHTYNYEYKTDSTQSLEVVKFCRQNSDLAWVEKFSTNYKNDCLGRASEKVVKVGESEKLGEYYYYAKYGDRATNRISTIRYGNAGTKEVNEQVVNLPYTIGDNLKYTYDSMGNISKIHENGKFIVSYEYDSINRLVRENNKQLDNTTLFTYDNNGNFLSQTIYAYSSAITEDIADYKEQYNYYYAPNTDKLMQIVSSVLNDSGNYVESTKEFAYDIIGNATTWNGKVVEYEKGRQVKKFDTTTFAYNGLGQRTSKTKNNVTINFTYDSNGKVISQSNGLEFIYDNSGVSGFVYDNNIYHYRKNVQGDITHLLDNNGNIVVKYVYDAWGNYAVVSDTNGLAELNPFRYRSYYYDTETGLYFLKTRYYDPGVGRFITIDDTSYLAPDQINGLNLYAYCGNNPVMFTDSTGHFPEWLSGIGRIVAGAMAIAAGVLVIASGVALVGMLIVAGVTIAAGALTVINGAADIQQSITGDNFVRDGIFGGNQTAYNWYAGIAEGVAVIGSMICGGWLKANQPRIQAYKNIGNYAQTQTVAGHTDRAYNSSILLQKQIIKYGKMTRDLQTEIGYVFKAAGSFNGSINTWRLVLSNAERIIWHFGFGF